MKAHLLLLLGLLFAGNAASATELHLAQPFQDHMVLQRQMPVPIWGWADPNKTITVKMGDQSATATSDSTGYWCAKLPAMEANATGQAITITDGAKTITLNDVLVGEVWICAGQSNMARSLKGEMTENPQVPKEFYTGDVDYPQIRFINYPNAGSDTPLADMDPQIDGKTTWEIVGPQTAGDSMVMAFFFGRNLYKDLQVPVGLVQVAVSGTTQTAWCSKGVLDSVKADGPNTYSYDDCLAAQEKALAGGKDPFKSWAEYKTALDAWRANPTGRPPGGLAVLDFPSVLFNALVHPLAPMAIRGVIWHQGEAGPYALYGQRLVAMADDWRKTFGEKFWFLFGTMTRFTTKGPPLTPAVESLRSGLNDQFQIAQKLGAGDNDVMVGMLDLGNVGTHWQRKDEAGRRLALAAMDHAYGKPSVYMGPLLVDSKIDGATVTCKFTNVGTGLKYAPSIDGISGFILVGKDNKAVWATPTIQGTDTITVSDPAVPAPENLFYGVYTNPHETLFNSEGLPAFSFHLKDQPAPRDKPPVELATAVPPMSDPKAALNVSDVHRYAYVVGFLNWHPVAGPNTINCYIPKEWAKPAAQQDGKELTLGDITTDAQGNRFVRVTAEDNGPPVVLYDAAQPDALSSANTKRY